MRDCRSLSFTTWRSVHQLRVDATKIFSYWGCTAVTSVKPSSSTSNPADSTPTSPGLVLDLHLHLEAQPQTYSLSGKSLDMGFVVLPALVPDISAVYDVYFAAFKDNAVTRALFPSATEADLTDPKSEFRYVLQ
jgi:hypothetical protein